MRTDDCSCAATKLIGGQVLVEIALEQVRQQHSREVMSTAQMAYEKDYEGGGEQRCGDDEGYCIDFHGDRFRSAKLSGGSDPQKRRPVEANRSYGFDKRVDRVRPI
jgi:hypothetical protein